MSDGTQLEVLENILKKKRHPSTDTKDSTKGGGDGSSHVSSSTAGVTVAASTKEGSSSSTRHALDSPSAYLPVAHNASEAFIDDDVLRGTLESGHYCLSIANQDVTELPIGLGE